MDRDNFERDQIAHEAEGVWTPPTAFFAREDQEFDGLGHDQFWVPRVLVRDAAVNRHSIVRSRSRPRRAVGVNGAEPQASRARATARGYTRLTGASHAPARTGPTR